MCTESQKNKSTEAVRCVSICGQKPREIKVQKQMCIDLWTETQRDKGARERETQRQRDRDRERQRDREKQRQRQRE